MKKRAKGRPPKKFGRKADQLNFRVTSEAREKIEKAAISAEMELSDWLRQVVEEAARKQIENG